MQQGLGFRDIFSNVNRSFSTPEADNITGKLIGKAADTRQAGGALMSDMNDVFDGPSYAVIYLAFK